MVHTVPCDRLLLDSAVDCHCTDHPTLPFYAVEVFRERLLADAGPDALPCAFAQHRVAVSERARYHHCKFTLYFLFLLQNAGITVNQRVCLKRCAVWAASRCLHNVCHTRYTLTRFCSLGSTPSLPPLCCVSRRRCEPLLHLILPSQWRRLKRTLSSFRSSPPLPLYFSPSRVLSSSFCRVHSSSTAAYLSPPPLQPSASALPSFALCPPPNAALPATHSPQKHPAYPPSSQLRL